MNPGDRDSDDRFEIVKLVGKGGFGEVYRAKQLAFRQEFREVALKLFAQEVVTSANAREVLNDAIIVLGLQEEKLPPEVSSRLVQVYDIGILRTPAPRAFMSMKLITGKTLKAEVSRYRDAGGMPVNAALDYLCDLLLPLAWMHTLEDPVVHGDLKPENAMLTKESRLVLIDFGLAAHLPLGVRGGTVAYDASEKLLGLEGEAPADVFSVGVIWYELLTGKHPFESVRAADGDRDAYVAAHVEARKWPIASLDQRIPANLQTKRIVPASEINKELAEEHPQIELLLNACLADDISQRPSNARILLDKIDYYRANGTLPPSDFQAPGGKGVVSGSQPPAASRLPAGQTKSEGMLLADAAALLKQGKANEALAMVEKIIPSCLKKASALALKARILIQLPGRLEEARKACDDALRLAPEDLEALESQIELLRALNKPTMAAGVQKRLAELRLRSPRKN